MTDEVTTVETTEAVNQQPAPAAIAPQAKPDTRAPFDRQKFEGFLGHYPEAEQVVLERLGLTGATERLQTLEIEAARGKAVTKHGLTAEEAEDLPGGTADAILAAAAYAAKIKAQYAGQKPAEQDKPDAPAKPKLVEQPAPPEPKKAKVSSVEAARDDFRSAF